MNIILFTHLSDTFLYKRFGAGNASEFVQHQPSAMWKFILLVAVLARPSTSYGIESSTNSYRQNLLSLMNDGKVSDIRNDCTSEETIKDCSEILSGFDGDELLANLGEASSLLIRICIQHLTSINGEKHQLTSLMPFMAQLGEANLYAKDRLCSETYTVINMNSSEQMRYIFPKLKKADKPGESIKYVSFSDKKNAFNEHVDYCYSDVMLGGEVVVIDYTSIESVIAGINEWFKKVSSDSADVVPRDYALDIGGLITGSYHDIEISCDQFNFYEQTEIEFKKSADLTIKEAAWVGEGRAFVKYVEIFKTLFIKLYMEDGFALIMKPEPGYENMEQFLSNILELDDIMQLMGEGSDKNISLIMPVFRHNFGSEDYVTGLKSKNLLRSLYETNSKDLPGVSSDGSYTYMPHMFNKVHLEFNCFETDTSSETFEAEEEIIINSAFVYAIYKGSWNSPTCMGTWFGQE